MVKLERKEMDCLSFFIIKVDIFFFSLLDIFWIVEWMGVCVCFVKIGNYFIKIMFFFLVFV